MKPWTYRNYIKSIEDDITYSIERLRFNINQASGYSYNELALRLDEFPSENVLALTALAVVVDERGALSPEDSLRDEIAAAYHNREHWEIAKVLDVAQRQEFLQDVELVSKVLGISPPLPDSAAD